MFGIDSSELAVVVILALIFIGPKDLPKVMRTVGYWVGRVRSTARHFTAGIENMVREAELEEMEKKWREENERIMRLHPAEPHQPSSGIASEEHPVSEPPLPFDESQPGDELPVDKRPLP
jgi:sec-independent protein translocase protein TatB